MGCNTDQFGDWCDSEFLAIAEGQGLSSITYTFNEYESIVRFLVEVKQVGSEDMSGVDTLDVKQVLWPTNAPDPLAHLCTRTPNWYPFVDAQPPVTGSYVRNACTGQRIYQPL